MSKSQKSFSFRNTHYYPPTTTYGAKYHDFIFAMILSLVFVYKSKQVVRTHKRAILCINYATSILLLASSTTNSLLAYIRPEVASSSNLYYYFVHFLFSILNKHLPVFILLATTTFSLLATTTYLFPEVASNVYRRTRTTFCPLLRVTIYLLVILITNNLVKQHLLLTLASYYITTYYSLPPLLIFARM